MKNHLDRRRRDETTTVLLLQFKYYTGINKTGISILTIAALSINSLAG
jgi:hypothetical protein